MLVTCANWQMEDEVDCYGCNLAGREVEHIYPYLKGCSGLQGELGHGFYQEHECMMNGEGAAVEERIESSLQMGKDKEKKGKERNT